MRNSSFQKEQVYQEIFTQLTESSSAQPFHSSPSKPIRLFSMYVANYTSIKKVEQIDEDCVKEYFQYLLQNHKRLSLSLSDIKKSMKVIVDLLGMEEEQNFRDFSLSNSSLWENLK
ncbi:swarming motility protein SwrAA [Metabacillus halosaccharovorans]|uniref:Swarming motility protein SwrAA n=1 Tax=Metabacillus halosaccharovorans TaxID=930124 RepID=A0ABT3DBL8_9BACI|nr:swarming motility protein SwrAA [Metabacillus halosaccharovorans]MCV9884448.1 Swarming motility protein SwrAA [Metabacillus halosaccharovorans]